ncbi:syndecan binding protein [Salpingoeca rosetta]|uniref:Syndecan binding protein n=1 Tax=Salpingoeca rosetta (strain ATCC 50818 / BSB-021) TaxID=946362 RepID=F2UJY6_SALR5|nr:syndecan binding protein [Salpingoeca rosetta]EGD77435.1 syndecan binding protein [Salpingoeca rosetta]|eukprot:XP_004990323.1 syndecan binding protein [Salpingoeca rosetta]
MSGLYPTLEDMTVDKEARAAIALTAASQQQQQPYQQPPSYASSSSAPSMASSYSSAMSGPYGAPPPPQATTTTTTVATTYQSPYASLMEDLGVDYLGIDTSPQAIMSQMPAEVQHQMQHDYQMQVATMPPPEQRAVMPRQDLPGSHAIAALTPQTDRGLVAGTIRQGVREIVLAKSQEGKLGIAVKAIDKGVFVSFVWSNSAAAMAGLRFGDQILQINGQNVAGFSDSKALRALKSAPEERVVLAIRDRPWCRSLTVRKDSLNHCGFTVRGGSVSNIVKDSSAARNGLLINHRLIEVNGQNVVGMTDKGIVSVIKESPPSVTLTIMPTFIYNHLIKKIGSSLIKKYMDHTIPEI